MKIFHCLADLNKDQVVKPIGITIGNFDGVHKGHQQLLKTIKDDCQKNGSHFVVVTFNPHPQKIIHPDKERFLINSYEQRRNLLRKAGVEYLVEFRFTRDFSTLSAEDFLVQHLLKYPAIHTIYLGYDFAFGANKQGGYDAVKKVCLPLGIQVEIQPKFEFHDKLVSSSLIRDHLVAGQIDEVEAILGRPFHLEGVVIKGEGRGKMIGFPTANIQVGPDLIVPHKGVYVTRTIYQGMTYNSVTNIGNNPTFKQGNQLHIETNIFDFDRDIYGETLDIQFLHKIRDEKKFPTVNDLIDQIRRDADTARNYQKNS